MAYVSVNQNNIKENRHTMFKDQKAFTLVEMLVVLMIISVLIILIVPNLSNQTKTVNSKRCEALISVVQSQTNAYYLEKGSYPSSIDTLASEKFIKNEQKTCPNDKNLKIDNGIVSIE